MLLSYGFDKRAATVNSNRLLTSTVTMFIYLGSIDFVVCFQGDACNGCGHVAVDNSKDYQPTQNHDNSEKSS